MLNEYTFLRPLSSDDWMRVEAIKADLEKNKTPFIVSTTQAYVKIRVTAEGVNRNAVS